MSSEDKSKAGISRRDFVRRGATAGLGATALGGLVRTDLEGQSAGDEWDYTADVVIAGCGTSGLSAAVSALDHGASVIMVDENYDCGGHGIVSGGNVNLGGGTSRQKAHGVEDSPDKVFMDWIRPEELETRYTERELTRLYADESAATFEFMIENGVKFEDTVAGGDSRNGPSLQWPVYEELITAVPSRKGSGVVRALEKSARRKGAQILLSHKMTSLVRESPTSGRLLGFVAMHEGKPLRFRGTKGVILATGGHTSNVLFRRIFDPRLTEEYQVAGEPWSKQNGDGELAAMAVGASLWGTASQTMEAGNWISKTAHIGCQWGYSSLHWQPESPIFDRVRASGLTGVDWQNAIMVKQTGRRFFNEVASGHDFYAAVMAWSGDPNKLNGGGPIWAIFDADAVTRQRWDPKPPNVDTGAGYFFSADTLAELAAKIEMQYQTLPMDPRLLEESVTRYNSFVDTGVDADFAKPTPKYKIQKPPFYAAWSTPVLHDTLCGLRTNNRCQVLDLQGQVISGLYAVGETQGGFPQHGLGRCSLFGRVAGRDAATTGAA
jgi:urocanate reductase